MQLDAYRPRLQDREAIAAYIEGTIYVCRVRVDHLPYASFTGTRANLIYMVHVKFDARCDGPRGVDGFWNYVRGETV